MCEAQQQRRQSGAHRSLAVDGRPIVEEGEHDLHAVRAAPLHDLLDAEYEVPVVDPCGMIGASCGYSCRAIDIASMCWCIRPPFWGELVMAPLSVCMISGTCSSRSTACCHTMRQSCAAGQELHAVQYRSPLGQVTPSAPAVPGCSVSWKVLSAPVPNTRSTVRLDVCTYDRRFKKCE